MHAYFLNKFIETLGQIGQSYRAGLARKAERHAIKQAHRDAVRYQRSLAIPRKGEG